MYSFQRALEECFVISSFLDLGNRLVCQIHCHRGLRRESVAIASAIRIQVYTDANISVAWSVVWPLSQPVLLFRKAFIPSGC